MLEKQVSIDQITILENGQILIREVTHILEDKMKISYSYHRRIFMPGSIIEGDQRLKDIASVIHTPQVIADFQESERQRRLVE